MGFQNASQHLRVAIIGSGFGGLGTAIQLKQHGITDFLIFERAGDVGGVWRDNHYPGCACDVELHLYSFSFAPNPDWTRSFSPQAEIWAYLQRCANEFDLLSHLRFDHDVHEVAWEESTSHWRIETSQGTYTALVLVMATGALSEPAIPQLHGLECFAGVTFHSAHWNHDVDLTGRRVAVIGTGASAIQFVPAIQPVVGHLVVFQRTPPWVLPRLDRPIPFAERRLFQRFPLAQQAVRARIYALRELLGAAFRKQRRMQRLERIARRYLETAIPDPVLRARLTPAYTLGCKRILLSDDYLPALMQPNVELVTAGIAELRTHAIVDHAGVEHTVDVIIWGTGFRVTEWPFGQHVWGRHGQNLSDAWGGSPKAHLGTTVTGFPNLFILEGPNTGLGHTSVLIMLEAQIAHVMAALRYMDRRGLRALEPRPEVQAAFVADVDRRMRGTVWTAGGCKSWYLDKTGRNSTLWPASTWSFRRKARFVPGHYHGR